MEKVKKLLQESPSLLNEHLNSVFFFFGFSGGTFSWTFCCSV